MTRTRTGTSTTLNSFRPNKQHKLARLKPRSKSQVTNVCLKPHIFYSFLLHNFIPNFIRFFTDAPRLCLVLSKDLPKQLCIYNNLRAHQCCQKVWLILRSNKPGKNVISLRSCESASSTWKMQR